MSNYLISNFKGIYRIRCECDKRTNQFPRKLNGTLEDIDCYIDCQNNIKIFHYGGRILEAYIPSIGRGNNIIKAIQSELGDDVIWHIEKTDSEIIFRFNSKHMEQLKPYLKPRTNGSNISPFSTKNLPKNKDYKIPDEDLAMYKEIVSKISSERILTLTHTTQNFLKSLITKKNAWEDIKADMVLKGLKGKEYIHSIGLWNKYIKYLKENI